MPKMREWENCFEKKHLWQFLRLQLLSKVQVYRIDRSCFIEIANKEGTYEKKGEKFLNMMRESNGK